MIGRIGNLFRVPDIRRRVWMTLLFLAAFRVGATMPIPGVDIDVFKQILKSREEGSSLIVLFNMLSAGSAAGGTLFSLGIMPYISASIIFSLLVKVMPRLEAIAKEGASGQRRINQWTRLATVPLSLFQAVILINQYYTNPDIVGGTTPLLSGFGTCLIATLTMTAGTLLLMWIGEQITEHGVGNGISLLIMVGIIARLPYYVHRFVNENPSAITPVLLIGLFLLVVVVVVYITKGIRRIPVQHARLMRGRRMTASARTFLPLKVNQAGVMPVIFSSALLAFPVMIGGALGWAWLETAMQTGSWWYTVLDAGLIFFFSYFWTSLMFNPAEISKNLREQGAFVPGIRPGRPTAEFLERVMIHMTLAGAMFLTVIAIVPSWLARQANADWQIAGFLGGTSILIVVSVALELVERLNANLAMHGYDTFMRRPGQAG